MQFHLDQITSAFSRLDPTGEFIKSLAQKSKED